MAARDAFVLDLADDENVVQYELVPDEPGLSPEGLEACRRDCLDVAAGLVQDYIWQRDAFGLRASTQSRATWRPAANSSTGLLGAPPASTAYLWGSARFGDNVDDAWFISWLLRELTRRFPALSARVWDNDGEFMLIEAAHALPRWVQPETAGNRVWLRDGKLHIIPLPSEAHPGLPSMPSIAQAHALLTGSEVGTHASAKVQAALEARWGAYPARARANTHRARCIMPRRIAGLLAREPGLVAAAVDAFVHRGPDDMRAAAAMLHFPPDDLLSVTVRFSRCLYAQTALQVFEAPRGFPMPPAASPTDPAARLGMKLTCGFEMLCAQHLRTQAPNEERPDVGRQLGEGVAMAGAGPGMPQGAIDSNPAVRAYLNSLQQRGYFQGNMPGSAAHTRLREAALRSFAASEQYERGATALAAPARRINDLLATLPSPELLDQMQGPEDSDAWMSSGAEELDAELAVREREQAKGGRSSGRPGFDSKDMVARMKAFVEAQAGYEGAEIPNTPGPQRGGVEFSNAAFWRQLGGALGLARHDSGSTSGSSEEGSSFFSRSGGSTSNSEASAGPAPAPAAGPPGRAMDYSAVDQSPSGEARRESSAGPAPDQPKGVRLAELDASTDRLGPWHRHSPQGVASQLPGGESAASETWEVCTATDSDDEAGFEGAYDAVLAEQLGGTSLAQTFRKAQDTAGATTATEPGQAAAAGSGEKDGRDLAAAGAGLQPVDVDLNLVQSLLASYAGQQGLPGPASNLAGLMGLRLPDNADD